MGLDGGRVSNAMGVPLDQWIMNQLNERSKQIKATPRDTDNLIYQANKTAWIRMASSVDVLTYEDRKYFRDKGILLKDKSDLAKKFVLQGGTSIYNNENNSFSYQQRAGLSGAYNVAGNTEISEYGYRPMPGITSVRVTTQGKMGSIRSADIQIKVWDKEQLDIMDALFFKLGYTMFLEWGHTNYYDSSTETLKQSETYSINPFAEGLTKEKIFNSISRNVIQSQGNYDAMLGMVTNFNFTYNQEGGYDCSVKLMALGVLASGIKINNPRILPDLQDDVIKQLVQTLLKIYEQQQARENALKNPPPVETLVTPRLTGEQFIKTYLKYDANTNPRNPGGGQVSYPATSPINLNKADFAFNTTGYGWVYFIRRLKGFIPIEDQYTKQIKVKITEDLLKKVKTVKLQGKAIDLSDPRIWDISGEYLESAKDVAKAPITAVLNLLTYAYQVVNPFNDGENKPTELQKKNDTATFTTNYVSTNGLSYQISVKRNLWGYSDKKNILSSYSNTTNGLLSYTDYAYEYIPTPEFTRLLTSVLNNNSNKYQLVNVSSTPLNTKTEIAFTVPIPKKVPVSIGEKKSINDAGQEVITPGSVSEEVVTFYVLVSITFNDSDFIKSFSVPSTVKEPIDFIGDIEDETSANAAASEVTATTPPEPPLKVSDIQKSEALKYQSAFEVIIRTIQLYSLNNAINTGIENAEPKVSKLKLTDSPHYQKFTKGLFSVGLFSNYIDTLLLADLPTIEKECARYDSMINTGAMTDADMIRLRSRFGFNFSLLGNKTSAKELLDKKTLVNYSDLLTTYTVPYKFNTGVFEGTQVNHPVYVKLGFVLMIINHICNIYDVKKESKSDTPLIYFDFNPSTNTCLSNAKQLSTNPYDILIPFEGFDSDFKSIIDPLVMADGDHIKAVSGSTKQTLIFKPQNKDTGDRLSADLPKFKIVDSSDNTEAYRGKTMNILISTDYLLKTVANYAKQDQSNDIYAKEFIEQLLFDINKYLGDFNMFRLAYDDYGNTMHVTDDQMTPNLENSYISQTNKTEFPLFGLGSLARSIEIKTEIASKLSNMLAISANSSKEGLSSLSKTSDSFGFYNLGYGDRYIPTRGELSITGSKVTDAMINSAIQFNKAIETYYSDTTPAESSVSHATNYFIERMSKIKGEENGSRASAVIPVSLNFSTEGISGLGMGQAFTVSPQFLPYTYDLSLRDPYGESDKTHTVGFVVVGLDQTIEGNQWLSNVRANMMYLKKRQDFEQANLRTEYAPSKGFKSSEAVDSSDTSTQYSSAGKCEDPYTSKNLDRGWIGKKQPFQRTIIDPNVEGPKLAAKYGKVLAKSIMAVIKIEQNFKGFNYNFGGYDITSGGWKFNESLHNGYVVAKEGGTGLCKAFVSFKSYEAFVEQKVADFKRKGFENATTANSFAKLWYEKWNGFGVRSKYPNRPISEVDAEAIKGAESIWNSINYV